jgi:hypothetical protein
MTQEEKQIAIAQVCGWKWIQTNHDAKSGLIGTNSSHSGNIPYQGRNYPSNKHLPIYGKAIPDYFNDLNAMHEVENKCIYVNGEVETDLALDYAMNLVIAAPAGRSMNATAAQRAEAIGKTLNLW